VKRRGSCSGCSMQLSTSVRALQSEGRPGIRSLQRSTSASSLLSEGRTGIRSFAVQHTDWPQTTVFAIMSAQRRPPVRFHTDKYRVGLFVPSDGDYTLKSSTFPIANPSIALRQQAGAQHQRRQRAWDEHVRAEHSKQLDTSYSLRRSNSNLRNRAAHFIPHDGRTSKHHRSAPMLSTGQLQGHRTPPAMPHPSLQLADRE